ncbi:MAG: hypothetical protein HYS20_06620 [Rhodocyclales bacterium]|nr:hypothetical protein [Rhodocyclales bacterium]
MLALPLFLLALAGCGERAAPDVSGVTQPPAVDAATDTAPDAAVAAFLERHWARPLAPQGQPPEKFSPLEASLAPADCGSCHAEQYRDWHSALHARAMGPGLMGQLVNMAPHARDEHQDCIRCHAPLAEQADGLVEALGALGQASSVSPAPVASPPLHTQGVVCAACHVRAHEHLGPPRPDGSVPDAASNVSLPHGGFTADKAFEDARFCSACHQFQPDQYALNGKLLENTYEEWKDSRHAREGRTCQSCHMPGRRHMWRGIHDPEMVRGGVDFVAEGARLSGGIVDAALTVRNSATGHYFPTYVTPRVTAEIEQVGGNGQALPQTRETRVIARQVPLDLGHEIADTRLPPDSEVRLIYARPRHPGAVALVYRLRVEPDEFYARFYRSLLTDGGAGQGATLIQEALAQAESSAFVAFEERHPLPEE